MRKIFFSSKGFSLVEIFMALGLSGGLIFALMTMTSSMTKTTLKTSTQSEIVQATNEIVSILSDSTNCTKSLGGKFALNDSTTATIFYKDVEKFKVNKLFGSTNEKIVSFVIAATASDVEANTSYLYLNFQKKAQLGGGVIPKKVSLYVDYAPTGTVTATSTIVSCSALASIPSTDAYLPWETKTATFTAQAKGRYFVDTTAETVSATLPSAPAIGDSIIFLDVAGNFDLNKLVLVRSATGENIMGLPENMDVSRKYISFELIYSGNATYGWRIK